MLNYSITTPEVLYTADAITRIDAADIAVLKEKAKSNSRYRIRICAHPDMDDNLHEMLIVLGKSGYIPPHRHAEKSESFHIIEGALKVVIFTGEGGVSEVIPMGPLGSGDAFFYRLSKGIFHTVVPMSEAVVFHEATNGPFRREDMEIPSWAPKPDAPQQAQEAYIDGLVGSDS